MKTLCLVRHAKSSWLDPKVEDKDRPIDPRGEADAKLLAQFLLNHHIKPDILLVSPALRTQMTAQVLIQDMQIPPAHLQTIDEIYEAGVESLLHIIQQVPNSVNSILLVGHNPGLTWLANYLADDHQISLPTCGAYGVSFDTNDWQEITLIEGKTIFVEIPKHTD